MAFDAGDIFRTYLQGASFVSDSLDRADARRRQAEEEELQKVAGRGLEIFAPKYDKDGKLIPRTSGDIFNDPQTLELANHPYMKSARMQGITDPNVKDVRYVSGSPLEDGRHVVPIVEQLDEDGNVISRGPLTEGRSRDGKSKVVPITVDTMFNHLAGEVYRRNPTLGKELMVQARYQALGGLRTQYRNTQDPNEREQLVKIWGSYGGSPDDLIKDSGAPVTKVDPSTGFIQKIGPDQSVTYERPTGETARLSSAYNNIVRANTGRDDRAKFETRLKFDQDTQGVQLSLKAGEMRNVETVKRGLSAEEGKIFDAGLSMAMSGDPATQAKGRETLAQIMPPEKIDPFLNSQKAKSSLSQGILTNFRDLSEEQVRDLVAANFSNLSKDDQLQAIQGLANGLKRGDPKAKAAFETAMMPQSVEEGKGSAPKIATFSNEVIDKVVKNSDLSEDVLAEARPQLMQRFGRLAQDFGITQDDEVMKSLGHMAAADAYKLEHDQDGNWFPGRAYSNAEGPMLIRRYVQSTGVKSVGETPREFMDKIYTPLVNETGFSITDPAQRKNLTKLIALASSIMDNGVGADDAVAEVVALTKNPSRGNRATEAMSGDSESARISSMGQALAKEIKGRGKSSLMSTLREGADYTLGGGKGGLGRGGMWR